MSSTWAKEWVFKMSVDNLNQDLLDAQASMRALGRDLGMEKAKADDAPEGEKERITSKIERLKADYAAASERVTATTQLLRSEKSYEAKQKAVEEKAKEDEQLKKEEKEHNKLVEQDKVKFDKNILKTNQEAGKKTGSNVVNGEELVRSEKPLTEKEILEKMQKMIEESQAISKKSESTGSEKQDKIELGDALPFGKPIAAMNSVTAKGEASALGTNQSSENEAVQLKGAAGSSGTST